MGKTLCMSVQVALSKAKPAMGPKLGEVSRKVVATYKLHCKLGFQKKTYAKGFPKSGHI